MKKVEIDLKDLQLLCLGIDYNVDGELMDEIGLLSLKFQSQHCFDTYDLRLKLEEGMSDKEIKEARRYFGLSAEGLE